jgi:hypothetical protein
MQIESNPQQKRNSHVRAEYASTREKESEAESHAEEKGDTEEKGIAAPRDHAL